MSNNITNFKSIKLKIASPDEILSWSYGEILKPETVNYRTQKFEKDGLFAENIFGPSKDWECYCGKYKRIRHKGIVCDKCGVEITRSSVRRERMGHIKLAAPASHIWFLKGSPSSLALLLDISSTNLEKIAYFAAYIVTHVDEKVKLEMQRKLNQEYLIKTKRIKKEKSKTKKNKLLVKLKTGKEKAKKEIDLIEKLNIFSELAYRKLALKYGPIFQAKTGAEALGDILELLNLEKLAKEIEKILADKKKQKNIDPVVQPYLKKISDKKRLHNRLYLVKNLIKQKINPRWMILNVIPVIAPDIRPIVQLDGGRFATSDLNDLYRRIINRNNRLKRLIELGAPEVIQRNEKRMLQEAVDALIDNSARNKQTQVAASTGQQRALRSLSDMLKGKRGRFRQNLLGKRVDYSGRSVIVAGPNLKLHQCGLPKKMALELFKPFVAHKLIKNNLAHNVRSANKFIEEESEEVWKFLEETITGRHVLLNRAPTLHRLGIQAFQPILIDGKAIQIHPLVCAAFNADFDGDQMAVHVPLGTKARKEAKEIILASKNLLKPATGEPIADPTKDMVWGCYYLTQINPKGKGTGKIFANSQRAILAYQYKQVDLRSLIKVRINGKIIKTTSGRIIFNQSSPRGMLFVNKLMDKNKLADLVARVFERHPHQEAVAFLDRIKSLGFKYSTISGLSWGMNDLKIPLQKAKIIKKSNQKVQAIQEHYEAGLLTKEEKKSCVIEIWTQAKSKIADSIKYTIDPMGSVFSMIDSKSRGSWELITQMSGMKGLVVNPKGEIIELPIVSNFKEGLNVLEYFISTHGTRKGMADTALRTATAGYLTRRLIDVAQDVVVLKSDCRSSKGVLIKLKDCESTNQTMSSRLIGRFTLNEIRVPSHKKNSSVVLVKKNQIINKYNAKIIEQAKIDEIIVRSPVACQMQTGICQKCYGLDLATNKLVEIGTAIGIIAAQSIGEPGTQLTLRTFKTGGVAGTTDMTQGLPRVEELFEARDPKGKAEISEIDGEVLKIEERGREKIVKIVANLPEKSPQNSQKNVRAKKALFREYAISNNLGLWVEEGETVKKGQQLCEGHIDLKKLFKLCGQEMVQNYIIREIQSIYSSEGAGINDKYIEIIIKQMFSRTKIIDPGNTDLLHGNIVEKTKFEDANKELKKGQKKAKAEPLLLGITKVALTSESWLSAASFQETRRILIQAATTGKRDYLRGLKENVIIGKLIPAGTGLIDK